MATTTHEMAITFLKGADFKKSGDPGASCEDILPGLLVSSSEDPVAKDALPMSSIMF